MKSYNSLLNNSVARRDELVDALIAGSYLPSVNKVGLKQASKSASLLEVLELRDFSNVKNLMRLQYGVFGEIDVNLFKLVTRYAEDVSSGSQDITVHKLLIPSEEVFKEWHQCHESYFAGFITKANELIKHDNGSYNNEELCEIITGLLQYTGNDTKGWTVRSHQATNLISVGKQKKRILIGPEKVKLNKKRLIGLLLHEIAIHVEWAEHPRHRQSIGNEEAVGTLVEQLSLSEYHPLRLYRFMAIGYAAGLDGTPKSMRETYENVLALRRILKPKEQHQTSKEYVAKEVVRVFRNLPPDKPGLVYIRDKQYFEHNTDLWRRLIKQSPNVQSYELIVKPWKDTL